MTKFQMSNQSRADSVDKKFAGFVSWTNRNKFQAFMNLRPMIPRVDDEYLRLIVHNDTTVSVPAIQHVANAISGPPRNGI
jgi:hypothetical protein